ncbi:insulinase family protein [Halorhodospira sp. M38]|nr:insulinase family protein [Halorhodospira sp. M38]
MISTARRPKRWPPGSSAPWRPANPRPRYPPPPSEPKETEVRIDFPASQTALMMGLPAIARGEEELEYPLRVANHVLGGGGLVSRLYQSMREERGLSYASSSSLNIMPLRGPWLIRSTVEAGRGEEALEVLRGEIERLARDGLDSEEIDAAVRHLTGAFPLSVANNSALAGQLSVLATNRLPADHLARYIPRMEAVDEQAIRRALDERLDLARMVTVLVGPEVEDADVEMDPP